MPRRARWWVCDRGHGGLRPSGSRSCFLLVCVCWGLYSTKNHLVHQERPYHNDSTASRLLSEVKHCRARLVLRWGTTLESLVLFFCISFVHLKYRLRAYVFFTTHVNHSTINQTRRGGRVLLDGVWVCICMYVYVFLRRKVSFNNQLNLDGRRDFYSLETECAGA